MACPVNHFIKTLTSIRESSNILVFTPSDDPSFKSNVAAINLFITGKELSEMPSSDLINYIYNTEKVLKGIETKLIGLESKFERICTIYKIGCGYGKKTPKLKSTNSNKKKTSSDPKDQVHSLPQNSNQIELTLNEDKL